MLYIDWVLLKQLGFEAEDPMIVKCEDYEIIISKVETDIETGIVKHVYNDEVNRKSSVGTICHQCNMIDARIVKNMELSSDLIEFLGISKKFLSIIDQSGMIKLLYALTYQNRYERLEDFNYGNELQ